MASRKFGTYSGSSSASFLSRFTLELRRLRRFELLFVTFLGLRCRRELEIEPQDVLEPEEAIFESKDVHLELPDVRLEPAEVLLLDVLLLPCDTGQDHVTESSEYLGC